MKSVKQVMSLLCLLAGFAASAQDSQVKMQEGNARYRQQQYVEAEALYAEALAIRPSRLDARYNRANTLVRLNRADEALKEFDDVAFKATEADLKSKAYYNKGVILSGQQKLEESIEAYKMTLERGV